MCVLVASIFLVLHAFLCVNIARALPRASVGDPLVSWLCDLEFIKCSDIFVIWACNSK